jgi:hypothetical protein
MNNKQKKEMTDTQSTQVYNKQRRVCVRVDGDRDMNDTNVRHGCVDRSIQMCVMRWLRNDSNASFYYLVGLFL